MSDNSHKNKKNLAAHGHRGPRPLIHRNKKVQVPGSVHPDLMDQMKGGGQ